MIIILYLTSIFEGESCINYIIKRKITCDSFFFLVVFESRDKTWDGVVGKSRENEVNAPLKVSRERNLVKVKIKTNYTNSTIKGKTDLLSF